MIFKTWLSDINKVALAVEELNDIQIAGTVNELNSTSLNSFVKGIDGLTLSQAQAALSTKALTNAQKEQILVSAGLLQSTEAITLEEVKQMASSASLSAQKKEEILTTLQGAYAEGEWNKEKLEAIVASGGEAGAIAKSILAKKVENSENIKELAGRKALTVVLWDELKARLALIATNPATYATLAIGAIAGLTVAYQKATLTIDEATEALEESKGSYDSISDEVSDLTEELTNCQKRMKELEEMGSLRSIVEDDELEKLQSTNVELTRRLAILKEEQRLKAVDVAKDASNVMTTDVESNYSKIYVGGSDERGQKVKPEEEMRLAIKAYREYAEEKAKIDAELLKDPENTELANESQKWQDKMDLAASRANEMAGYINQTEEAYKQVIDTGGTLTSTQTDLYNSSIALGNEYLAFTKEINGVNEAFENLDTTEKAQTLKDRYAKKTLSLPNGQGTYTVEDKEISDWIDTLSDEDLKILGTINFSGEQTRDSMQEALDYAKTHTDITVDEISFDSASFLESVSAIQSGYEKLLSAQEEFNEYGAITASTLKDLMENDLIQYLQFTADGLTINTQALEDNEQALKDAATAELYNAMCNDIQNLSLGDTASLSDIAQTAIANLDSVATTAGENAAIAAQGWWEYGASIQSIPGVSDLTGDNYKKALAIVDQYKNIANSINSLSIGNTNSTKKSSSKSSSSTKDAIKEAFQAEYNTLKHNLEMEYITEEQYYNSLNALNQKYFAGKEKYLDEYRQYEEEVYKGLKNIYKDYVDSYLSYMKQSLESSRIDYKAYSSDVAKFLKDMYEQGKIAAKDYYDYTKDMLEVQKDAMDGVISAVINRLDNEIESYEDQIDSVEERYQIEIDYLDTVIKYYEDQKKALQDSNDELDRQKALEEALYNLKRAQNQRTKMLYTADKGMIYTADTSAIRDAEEEVRQSKLDIEIAKLDDAIEKLERQQDALQDAMDREKEQLQDSIDRLEEYKDQWNSVSDEYENAQNEMYANGILGLGWQTEILNGNQSILNNFKDKYISIQQAITDAAWESANSQIAASKEAGQGIADITGIGNALDEATNSLRNYNSETENISQEPYNSIIDGAQEASNAIGGEGQGGHDISYDDMKAETVARQKDAKNTSSSGSGSLVSSVNNLEAAEGSAQQSSKALMDEISNGAGTAKGQVDGIKASVEELDGAHAEVTIDIKVNGSVPNLSGLSGGKGSIGNTMQRYATGTENAKPGVHEIAENGDELIIDNYDNVFLAKGHQLYDFEGGETVKDAKETKELLSSQLIPVDTFEFMGIDGNQIKVGINEMANMWKNTIPMPNMFNNIKLQTPSTNTSGIGQSMTIENMNITCPGITSDDVAKQIGSALKKEFSGMSLKAYQISNITR